MFGHSRCGFDPSKTFSFLHTSLVVAPDILISACPYKWKASPRLHHSVASFSNIYYFQCRMFFGRSSKGYDTMEAYFPSPLRTANASYTRYAGGRFKSEHVWTAVIVLSSVSSFFVLRHCRCCLSTGISVQIRSEPKATRKAFFTTSMKKRSRAANQTLRYRADSLVTDGHLLRTLTLFFLYITAAISLPP